MQQVLVQKFRTVHTATDLGRFQEITPLSNIITHESIGVEVCCFDRAGKQVSGVVVDMREDMEKGMFPRVSGIILDTEPYSHIKPQYKRMAQGGVLGSRK